MNREQILNFLRQHKQEVQERLGVHEYFEVNDKIVWNKAKKKLPNLKLQVNEIIKSELKTVSDPSGY